MNGVHDMGGMDGFGAVVREPKEPVFHESWEKRVFGIQVATASMIPLPHSRSLMEQIEPGLYVTSGYYERWLRGRIAGLIEIGAITAEEFSDRVRHYRENPEAAVQERAEPERVKRILQGLFSIPSPIHGGGPAFSDRESRTNGREVIRPVEREPSFGPGDSVRVRNLHPAGHTRLPRYVRGKRGVVDRFYGFCDLQDALPPEEKTPAAPLYSVRFEGSELWGDAAEKSSVLYLDMWETYLEPREDELSEL